MNPLDRLREVVISPEIEAMIERLPAVTGKFSRDPWGFDKDKTKLVFAIVHKLYTDYFRVQTLNIERIPTHGRVLLIGNHSGQLPMDGMLIGMALATNPHGPRAARAMIERFFPTVPFVGNMLNHLGAVVGDPHNCTRMLENEEAIVVFPEGIRGSGKPYKERYQLKRFGNGFLHLAMNHRTPIVPIGVVGCEETMPSLTNIKPLAKALGLPYFPLALPVPLPARVTLNFGEPMFFDNDVHSEEAVTERVDQVKARIRLLLEEGLATRESVF
ncbi:MAG: lysophospholipid acyltransferase family protein [Gammaproteobacteria bacterium]